MRVLNLPLLFSLCVTKDVTDQDMQGVEIDTNSLVVKADTANKFSDAYKQYTTIFYWALAALLVISNLITAAVVYKKTKKNIIKRHEAKLQQGRLESQNQAPLALEHRR